MTRANKPSPRTDSSHQSLILAMRAVTGLIALAFIASATAATAQSSAPGKYLDVWYPHTSDLSDSESRVLSSLLQLVKTTRYTVSKGENLDVIIRKLFCVSATQEPHAYTLYLQRILTLNPGVNQSTIYPGTVLRLPSGPLYGATRITEELSWVRQSVFAKLSTNAHGSSPAHHKRNDPVLQGRIARQLKPYLFPDHLDSITDDEAFAAARLKGLLPPADVEQYPEQKLANMDPVELEVGNSPDSLAAMTTLKTLSPPGRVFPGLIPMAKPAPSASCANTCTSLAAILNLPANLNLSGARLLIEDTGIGNDFAIPDSNYVYKGSKGDGIDIDPRQHGTFVYSEVAQSGWGHGPLPESQIYVAKAAEVAGDVVGFPMRDVMLGWRNFVQTVGATSDGAAATWVANLSAAGIPDTTADPKPTTPYDTNLLLVAAAGNDGNPDAPSKEIFDSLCNGDVNLLIVGSLNSSGQLASYSNYHPTNVQLVAQGDCVCGDHNLAQIDGTSQASPIVAFAAAALASKRPTWLPQEVMWRLLSTADRLPSLKDRVFAGRVNLVTALRDGIIATVKDPTSGQLRTVVASKIQFSGTIADKLVGIEAITPNNKILRLYDRVDDPPKSCFNFIRYQILEEKQLLPCVPSSDQVTFTEDAQVETFPVANLVDLILPIPSDRDTTVAMPTISVK
jgi:hypothetical protein